MQYVGKDALTRGSLLHLDRKKAWELLRSRAKQGIRKARKAGVRVVESRDLLQMAKVWYNPDTLTQKLDPEQRLYLAYLGDQLVGGIIVTPVSSNTLFYHYGGSNELGRSIEVNAYLFWHIVEQFHDSPFGYLDVGVSFREELQHYFQKYCTQSYPILFRPPDEEVQPKIRLNSFSAFNLDWVESQAVAINTQLYEFFEAEFTYMPTWPFALQSAFRALDLPKNAGIGVWSSVGEASYVELLTKQFGDSYRFSARNSGADAFVVAHRWSVPCVEVEALSSGKTPVIEDCRDLLYGQRGEQHFGSFGRYAVFDFARWFPMQFGAALVGEYFPDRVVWDRFHCLDVTKRNLIREWLQIHWLQQSQYNEKRKQNWALYSELFALLGMCAIQAHPSEVPLAFLLHSESPYTVEAIQQRLAQFGVITEMDASTATIALPCHEGLSRGQVEYIFGAFRGMINPCHTFVRKDPAKVG
jgi:hypothetical protein